MFHRWPGRLLALWLVAWFTWLALRARGRSWKGVPAALATWGWSCLRPTGPARRLSGDATPQVARSHARRLLRKAPHQPRQARFLVEPVQLEQVIQGGVAGLSALQAGKAETSSLRVEAKHFGQFQEAHFGR